jgi:hypothetical protein
MYLLLFFSDCRKYMRPVRWNSKEQYDFDDDASIQIARCPSPCYCSCCCSYYPPCLFVVVVVVVVCCYSLVCLVAPLARECRWIHHTKLYHTAGSSMPSGPALLPPTTGHRVLGLGGHRVQCGCQSGTHRVILPRSNGCTSVLSHLNRGLASAIHCTFPRAGSVMTTRPYGTTQQSVGQNTTRSIAHCQS